MGMNLADARYQLGRLRPRIDEAPMGCLAERAGIEHQCGGCSDDPAHEVLAIAEDLLEQLERTGK